MIFSSAKVSYGIAAIYSLAIHWSNSPLQASEIAREQGIPENFLRTILGTLIKHGFVVSTFGSKGGYKLARPPSQISIDEVIEALSGPIAALHKQPRDKRLMRYWQKRSEEAQGLFRQSLAEFIDEISGDDIIDDDEAKISEGEGNDAREPHAKDPPGS